MATVLRPSEWANQAALDSLLRYQPQLEGLALLKQQAEERAYEAKQAGRSEGILGTQAAEQALPATQSIYNRARAEDARTRALLASAGLPANSPFAIAAGNEQAANQERLGEAQARAESDLQSRKVAAASAPQFADEAALAKLARELQSIARREGSIRGDEGLATAAELLKLRGEADKLLTSESLQGMKDTTSERTTSARDRTSEANNQRTTSTSRANNQETNSTRRSTTAETNRTRENVARLKGSVSPKEVRKEAGELSTMRQIIGQFMGGKSRGFRVAALSKGLPGQTVKQGSASVKVAGYKAYAPNGIMAAALDWAEYGHLMPHTEARLRSEGYDPRALGVPSYNPVATLRGGRPVH
jgi:hypothetical protein